MQDKLLGTLTNWQALKNLRINFLHNLWAQDQQYFFSLKKETKKKLGRSPPHKKKEEKKEKKRKKHNKANLVSSDKPLCSLPPKTDYSLILSKQ